MSNKNHTQNIMGGGGGHYPLPIPPQTMSWPIEKPVLRFDRGSLKSDRKRGTNIVLIRNMIWVRTVIEYYVLLY